jgi:hypothetical protein
MKTLNRIRNRQGRCYELAGLAMLIEEGSEAFTLVHGILDLSFLGLSSAYAHAWIELPDGRVYDPNMHSYMPKAEYYSRYKPRRCQRYTRLEMAKLAVRHHWGPWTESERGLIEFEALAL